MASSAPREPARSPAADRVLEAAVEAFAERGFHGTTTRQIAAHTGMSPAAVYVHYRSKEELLYEISLAGHEHVLTELREMYASAGTATERLAAMVHAFVLRHARGHLRARIVNYELAALAPEHIEAVVALRREMTRVMRRVIDEGTASGEFTTPDPSMTCLAILSLGIDVARWYRDGGRWTPEDVADHYRDLALRMVGADQPTG